MLSLERHHIQQMGHPTLIPGSGFPLYWKWQATREYGRSEEKKSYPLPFHEHLLQKESFYAY